MTVVVIFCCCICYYSVYFSYSCAAVILLSFLQKHVSSSLTVCYHRSYTLFIMFAYSYETEYNTVCVYIVEFKEQSCTHSLMLTSLWMYNGKSIGIVIALYCCCCCFCIRFVYTFQQYEVRIKQVNVCLHS